MKRGQEKISPPPEKKFKGRRMPRVPIEPSHAALTKVALGSVPHVSANVDKQELPYVDDLTSISINNVQASGSTGHELGKEDPLSLPHVDHAASASGNNIQVFKDLIHDSDKPEPRSLHNIADKAPTTRNDVQSSGSTGHELGKEDPLSLPHVDHAASASGNNVQVFKDLIHDSDKTEPRSLHNIADKAPTSRNNVQTLRKSLVEAKAVADFTVKLAKEHEDKVEQVEAEVHRKAVAKLKEMTDKNKAAEKSIEEIMLKKEVVTGKLKKAAENVQLAKISGNAAALELEEILMCEARTELANLETTLALERISSAEERAFIKLISKKSCGISGKTAPLSPTNELEKGNDQMDNEEKENDGS